MGKRKANAKLSEEALKELQECVEDRDTERAHPKADDVLCSLLINLGYSAVVDKYNQVYKWYA